MSLASAGPASAGVLFSDGFEESDFVRWSQALTRGDGRAVIDSSHARTGSLAAQLSTTAARTSKAYLRATFGTARVVTVRGHFAMIRQPGGRRAVPVLRLLAPSSRPIVSVDRAAGPRGALRVGFAGRTVRTRGALRLGRWATLTVGLSSGRRSGTVRLRLDGRTILRARSARLRGAGAATLQVGNDLGAHAATLRADTIRVTGTPRAQAAPVNGAPPMLAGTPQAGEALTASPGLWATAAPGAFQYQWNRCTSSCAPIAGATAPTYVATAADVGSSLQAAVTAANAAGAATSTSAPTAPVQSTTAAPSSAAAPTITGTATVGQTLTAGAGGWGGTQPMSFGFQWQRCTAAGCAAIAGDTAATHTVTPADAGASLRVAVAASNAAGAAGATSAATATVAPAAAAVATPSLAALWHMDELSGTVMADAVGGHNGTLHSVALGAAGALGRAYTFNGSNGYVSVPSAAALNPGSATLTVTIHLKATAVPAKPDWDLIRKGLYTTPGGEYKMEYQPSGQASCGFKGSSGYSELIAGPRVNDGQWHTIQCVKTASSIRVVVDGVAFSKSGAVGSIANSVAVPVGARPGSEFFKGALDEASIQIG